MATDANGPAAARSTALTCNSPNKLVSIIVFTPVMLSVTFAALEIAGGPARQHVYVACFAAQSPIVYFTPPASVRKLFGREIHCFTVAIWHAGEPKFRKSL